MWPLISQRGHTTSAFIQARQDPCCLPSRLLSLMPAPAQMRAESMGQAASPSAFWWVAMLNGGVGEREGSKNIGGASKQKGSPFVFCKLVSLWPAFPRWPKREQRSKQSVLHLAYPLSNFIQCSLRPSKRGTQTQLVSCHLSKKDILAGPLALCTPCNEQQTSS